MSGSRRASMLRGVAVGALGIVCVLLAPWAIAVALGVRPIVLPPIGKVVNSLVELVHTNVLVPALLASLLRVNLGFALAVASAVPLGVVLARSRALYRLFEPVIESFRFVIPFAWIPLAILWFGTHESGKIFIVWYAGFFIILLQTISAVRDVDPDLVKAARTLGASEAQIIRKVVLPAALPTTITGLRIGFAVCWISVLAAELVAARSGLGYMVMDARELLETDIVIVGMATIGVVGAGYNWLFESAQRLLFRHHLPFERL